VADSPVTMQHFANLPKTCSTETFAPLSTSRALTPITHVPSDGSSFSTSSTETFAPLSTSRTLTPITHVPSDGSSFSTSELQDDEPKLVVRKTFLELKEASLQEQLADLRRSRSEPLVKTWPDLTSSEGFLVDAEPNAELINGSASLPSQGSAGHDTGDCRPCAWFWRPGSCRNGKDCRHCHLCPEGETIRRKKLLKVAMKFRGEAAKKSSEANVPHAPAINDSAGTTWICSPTRW